MRWFSFGLLISGGAVLGHLYLYRRLIRPLRLRRSLRLAVAGLLLFMAVFLLLREPLRGIGPGVKRVHDLVAYAWMALATSFVVATAFGDAVRLVGAVARWIGRRRAEQPSRSAAEPVGIDAHRRAIIRAFPVTVLGAGAITAVYSSARAFAPAEISEVPVRLPRLPRALDGLTIVQLTDVHVGPFIGRRFMERLVDQANALKPDLVVITGDLVDGNVPTLGQAVSTLGGLRARFGSYFVTGNHEYYSGDLAWTGFLEQLGISVLRNRHVAIGDGGGTLDLVGVDDWSGGRRRQRRGYDLEAALRGRNGDRAAVLLSHQPRNFEAATARGIGLQISGHTHGGQIFPMTAFVGLEYEYTRGLYRHQDSHIYVSRGCGFWGPPSRLGSPPEIAKLVLTA
jgi:predicted MPP superfamily phosphohydrolase